MSANGLFITFEGGDGSGKSTLAKAVLNELQRRGYEVLLTREPGGTELAEAIRKLFLSDTYPHSPRTELLLVLAARNDHVEKVIQPALDRGAIVLCDRFIDSTVVYQGYATVQNIDEIESLALQAVPLLPDQTFLLDIPLQESVVRRKRRASEALDKIEKQKEEFHERVRQGFLEHAKKYPKRIVSLDSMKSVSELFDSVMCILTPLLPKNNFL